MYEAAASVVRAQLSFPPADVDAVLAQLGPIGESENGIALYDFFAVRDELRRRHGIQAVAPDEFDMATADCEFYGDDDDDEGDDDLAD
jgi:hypothetical protein